MLVKERQGSSTPPHDGVRHGQRTTHYHIGRKGMPRGGRPNIAPLLCIREGKTLVEQRLGSAHRVRWERRDPVGELTHAHEKSGSGGARARAESRRLRHSGKRHRNVESRTIISNLQRPARTSWSRHRDNTAIKIVLESKHVAHHTDRVENRRRASHEQDVVNLVAYQLAGIVGDPNVRHANGFNP